MDIEFEERQRAIKELEALGFELTAKELRRIQKQKFPELYAKFEETMSKLEKKP